MSGEDAEMWRTYRGSYQATEEKHQGKEVYRSSDGFTHLYKYSDGTWRVSEEAGDYGVYKSVDSAECPTNNSEWQYRNGRTGKGWLSGDITVKCT